MFFDQYQHHHFVFCSYDVIDYWQLYVCLSEEHCRERWPGGRQLRSAE